MLFLTIVSQPIISQTDGRVHAVTDYLLIDDFTRESSALGTEWEGFTDRVMGGVSEMRIGRIPGPDGPFIRMTGSVSLENNGGFVQIRLELAERGGVFDGSEYRGIRVRVRGKGDGYYIFLRTANTLLPWKFYKAPVPVSEEWAEVDIPWTGFESGDYGRSRVFSSSKLKSVALVAYGKAFEAEIDLAEIGFYR